MKHTTHYIPGKLLIAGEYAVLHPDCKSVVMAVDRYVRIDILDSTTYTLNLPDLGLQNITWTYTEGRIQFSIKDDRLLFIQKALETVLQYLYKKNANITLPPFTLNVHSELNHMNGAKIGLGSSAAITVGIIRSLLAVADSESLSSNHIIFKLAVIAHFSAQKNGSGADIAASVFGGLLQYATFSQTCLPKEGKTIHESLNNPWDYHIQHLPALPEDFSLLIGWTGTPVSTGPLVHHIQAFQEKHPKDYDIFLRHSNQAVDMFIQGSLSQQSSDMYQGIRWNRQALRELQHMTDAMIETESLALLANTAEDIGAAAKSSGAGGGDCGIAFLPKHLTSTLQEKWRSHRIETLDIHPVRPDIHSS